MLQQAVHFVICTHTYIYIIFVQSFQLSWQGSPQFGNKMPIFFWVVSDGTGQHLRRGGKKQSRNSKVLEDFALLVRSPFLFVSLA